ncbi:MAG: hypothetical protein ACWA6U_18210 [Breznakibacter sp.]
MLLNDFWENKYVKIIAILMILGYTISIGFFYYDGNMPLFLMKTAKGQISNIDKYSTVKARGLKVRYEVDCMEFGIAGSKKRFIHPDHIIADRLRRDMKVTVWYHTANSLTQVVQITSGSEYIVKHDEKKAWRITFLFVIHSFIILAIVVISIISNRQEKRKKGKK